MTSQSNAPKIEARKRYKTKEFYFQFSFAGWGSYWRSGRFQIGSSKILFIAKKYKRWQRVTHFTSFDNAIIWTFLNERKDSFLSHLLKQNIVNQLQAGTYAKADQKARKRKLTMLDHLTLPWFALDKNASSDIWVCTKLERHLMMHQEN